MCGGVWGCVGVCGVVWGCVAVWGVWGCVAVWLCGCVAVWLCGCACVCGCVAVGEGVAAWLCVCGCVALWLCGCVRLCGCVAVWLWGCVSVWLWGPSSMSQPTCLYNDVLPLGVRGIAPGSSSPAFELVPDIPILVVEHEAAQRERRANKQIG